MQGCGNADAHAWWWRGGDGKKWPNWAGPPLLPWGRWNPSCPGLVAAAMGAGVCLLYRFSGSRTSGFSAYASWIKANFDCGFLWEETRSTRKLPGWFVLVICHINSPQGSSQLLYHFLMWHTEHPRLSTREKSTGKYGAWAYKIISSQETWYQVKHQ